MSPSRVAAIGLLPAAGYLAVKQKTRFAIALALIVSLAALCIVHAVIDLPFLTSYRGSFVYAWLVRDLAFAYAFCAIDAYMLAAEPDALRAKARLALGLNVIAPGLGFAVVFAWPRVVTGILIASMVVVFARLPNMYLDIVFILVQLATGVAGYYRVVRDKNETFAQQHKHETPGQLIGLGLSVLVIAVWGLFVQLRLPDNRPHQAKRGSVRMLPSPKGITLSIPILGFEMTAAGDDWVAETRHGESLFAASHIAGGSLQLVVHGTIPFVGAPTYLEQLAKRLRRDQDTLEQTSQIRVSGLPAIRAKYRSTKEGTPIEQQLIAIHAGKLVYMVLFRCGVKVCDKLSATFQRTEQSIKIGPALVPRPR